MVTLLPPTQKGRGARSRCVLSQCFQELITFCGCNDKISESKSPIIVAQGVSKKDISKYYISFDKSIIITNNTLSDAIDLLFKIHAVFGIEYNQYLTNFYKYIEHFVFDISETKSVTTTVRYCHSILSLIKKSSQ